MALAGRMDRLVVVSPYRIEKSGCVSRSTTVCGVGVAIDATVAMLDAAAAPVFGLSTRSSDALTSADVSGLPSSNRTPERKVNVTLLASLLNVQPVARSGTTWRLELRVTSGWYIRPRACRSRKLVAICGSSFCTLEVLPTTKGPLPVPELELAGLLLPLELQAARPILSATSAAAGAPRRDSEARGMFPPGGGGARGRRFGWASRSCGPGACASPARPARWM